MEKISLIDLLKRWKCHVTIWPNNAEQSDDYSTRYLLGYPYFKENEK